MGADAESGAGDKNGRKEVGTVEEIVFEGGGMDAQRLNGDRANLGTIWGADFASRDAEVFEDLGCHLIALGGRGERKSGHSESETRKEGGSSVDV